MTKGMYKMLHRENIYIGTKIHKYEMTCKYIQLDKKYRLYKFL